MVYCSAHFVSRQEQRGLKREVLSFIMEFGTVKFYRKGTWLVVERRTLPALLKNSSLARRAAQWLVLVNDGVLVTCYRCNSPLRKLRRLH